MPRVHVRAGADIAMERAAAAVAELRAEGAPGVQGERAEAAGKGLGAGLGEGREAREGAAGGGPRRRGGRGREREEVPLPVRLGRGRRRAGPGTPAPAWKLEPSPGPPEEEEEGEGKAAATAAAAPAVAAARRSSASASASARQLGASLWEIHDVMGQGRRGGARRRRTGRGLAAGGAGSGVEVDQPQSSGGFDRNLADSLKDYHKLHQERSHAAQPFSPASYTSSIGDSSMNRAISPARSLVIKGRSRGPGYNLSTSTELLKVLNRIWSLEEQHTANMSVVKGLKLELQQAQARIQELTQERRGYRHEVASLMRQLSEDKLVRKTKDQEKIERALCSLQNELEDERRLRWHSEGLHRKFGKELSEIKSAYLEAVKDLEKEKKTNRLLEDLCDQFAMGIQNYEEEVSMLKQRHANNYENKFDKSVLHISEAWLDERMQMQNIDIQKDLLEKTTVIERLSSEIQAFVLAKKSGNSKNSVKYMNDSRQDASLRRQSLESVHLNGATSAPQLADDDDDSVASDLHCFELNMHGNDVQNHGRSGPRRSGMGSMDAPKRISEYSHSTAGESSDTSHVPIYSQKDEARSGSIKPQYVTRTPEINSYNSSGITPAGQQNEITYANISRGSHIDSSMHKSEARHADCLGQESLHHYSRTSLFCEGTTSGDLCNLHSPSRQLNYQSTPLGHEIFECSPALPVGVKENTLKAKLLQARLEGRHARLKSSGGSLSSRRK